MSVRIKSDPDASHEESAPAVSTSGTVEFNVDDNDEEEVEREIDVFLSPDLANQMYLVQFPLQHKALSQASEARIKTRHHMVELDHQTPDDIPAYGQYHMPTRTYSSRTVPVSTHMALGKLVDEPGMKGLHLIPLSNIFQMHPSFHHVDEATINPTSTPDDDVKRERSEAQATMERKPLSFQKKESERAALARKSSYGYKTASEDAEPWQTLSVHRKGSMESNMYTNRSLCQTPENKLHVFVGKDLGDESMNSAYVHSLNYLPSSDNRKDGNDTANATMDLSAVCTQLVNLLRKGMPIPFSLLRNHFPPSVTDETLLVALGSCAFFIRGNVILQSRLLGLSPALAQARTVILLILQTMGVVYRSRLEAMYKEDTSITSESILMLLQQVAQKTRNDGWKLKIDDDVSFASEHPDTLLNHLKFWGDQVQRYGSILDKYRAMDGNPFGT